MLCRKRIKILFHYCYNHFISYTAEFRSLRGFRWGFTMLYIVIHINFINFFKQTLLLVFCWMSHGVVLVQLLIFAKFPFVSSYHFITATSIRVSIRNWFTFCSNGNISLWSSVHIVNLDFEAKTFPYMLWLDFRGTKWDFFSRKLAHLENQSKSSSFSHNRLFEILILCKHLL